MTTSVTDYYLAGLVLYTGNYPLTEIRCEGRETGFVFDMHEWSLAEIQEAYDSTEGQPITDVKKFCESLQRLTALQKKARQIGMVFGYRVLGRRWEKKPTCCEEEEWLKVVTCAACQRAPLVRE